LFVAFLILNTQEYFSAIVTSGLMFQIACSKLTDEILHHTCCQHS